MIEGQVRRYGVKEQTPAGDAAMRAAEEIRLLGYACVDSGLAPAQRAGIAAAFECAHAQQRAQFGGVDHLRALDEHHTIRAPYLYEDAFLELAQNPVILALTAHLIGGAYDKGGFILNQQNGIVNPPRERYNQASFHRDLPYQHFVSSRPLAINALYCVDDFTASNGATLVLPGSHRMEAFPSDETVRALTRQIEAPAGSFIVLDCMTYHSGADNTGTQPRRAVNHLYSIPLMRQQIDIPRLLGEERALPEATRKLLGYGLSSTDSLEAFYAARAAKMKPASA